MKILFLTLGKINSLDERGLYTDLIQELAVLGHNIDVVSPIEKNDKGSTSFSTKDNIRHLKVKIGNITKTKSIFEKGLSTILVGRKMYAGIKKYLKLNEYDLILYSTPPITLTSLITKIKRKSNARTYLMLKDIFPQNAVDIGYLKKKSPIWLYFRLKEVKLYSISDNIGCMSQANVDYLIDNNKIRKDKVEIFPNSIKPTEKRENGNGIDEVNSRHKYNIPADKTLFVYGGNLGIPQGINFILEVISQFHLVNDAFLLIVGDGTEFDKLELFIDSGSYPNVKLMRSLEKNDYDSLLNSADVGLVFLDYRFTIPNFPSRINSYLENSIPVIAATDRVTDIRDLLEQNQIGLWSESKDPAGFISNANRLSNDRLLRIEYGKNGRLYLEEKFAINKNVNIIISK